MVQFQESFKEYKSTPNPDLLNEDNLMILSVCPNPSVDKFIMLEELKSGQVNRSQGEQAYPGGKATHVAIAVRELGFNSKLAGFWGGPTGQWIRDECSLLGIESTGPNLKEWTRTCLSILTGPHSTETEILEKGPSVSPESIQAFFRAIELALPDADALVVSGSWPDQSPDDVYITLKKLTDSFDIPLWVDASAERLQQAIQVHPFGIHINKTEACTLFGENTSPEAASRKLLQYCTTAAVTDGANGLFLSMGKQTIHAHKKIENIMSTIGSGDCLLAGLITSHLTGGDLSEMARIGTACGAANCIRKELGMLYKRDVEKLKPNINIDILNESV
jgi:tagatose 6-phosphate kinase